jgi:hypothetical protein
VSGVEKMSPADSDAIEGLFDNITKLRNKPRFVSMRVKIFDNKLFIALTFILLASLGHKDREELVTAELSDE